MTDSIQITAGSGTTIATDDIGGTHYQRVKLSLGADGTANDAVAGTGVDGTGVLRVSLATDVALPAGTNLLGSITPEGTAYETVAASQTDQALGATGASGDYLSHILVIPGTTSPGNVLIQDGAGSAITVFTGGASSVTSLVPFSIPLGIASAAGAWSVTTGANVTAIAVGTFT